MSRLKRNIARRDKAYELFVRAQEVQLLNVEPTLVAILRDIPSSAFKHARKPTPEWDTLALVAQTATACGLWSTSIHSVHEVMPNDDPDTVEQFRHNWAICKQKTPCGIGDFLALVQNYDAV